MMVGSLVRVVGIEVARSSISVSEDNVSLYQTLHIICLFEHLRIIRLYQPLHIIDAWDALFVSFC